MSKRKIDCTLDEIVGEYLKKGKFEKSRKLYEENIRYHENDETEILEKFLNHLKAMRTKKAIKIEDLDFEINFGAYQTDQKVSDLIFISTVASPASFDIKNYGSWSQITG